MAWKSDDLLTDDFLDSLLPGNGPSITEVKEQIYQMNHHINEIKSAILLGETGVGKTYIAKVIAMHRCWLGDKFMKEKSRVQELEAQRRFYCKTRGRDILFHCEEPYHEISLPSLEGDLARSQLFGHIKNAFTGALTDHTGFLGLPTVTDVLLDEIGYATRGMQRDLLQVLQSGVFYKVGSTKKERTSVRLIFATNQDLRKLIEKKRFQEDLFWRIIDHVINIPPLRERTEEIPVICESIIDNLNRRIFDTDKTGESYINLTSKDIEWAKLYKWPGNVRELEKTVNRWFLHRGSWSLEQAWRAVQKFLPIATQEKLKSENSLEPDKTITQYLQNCSEDELRKDYYQKLLEAANGNKTEAANIAGVNKKTFWGRLKKYSLV
jgi:DNA-binding NtrC family response regulator